MEEIIFRLAVDADVERINHFYNSVYKSNRDALKFNWEYNSAPAGKAIYVVAEHNNAIVGTQCVIPYYIITQDNKSILSGKSEDTLVSPGYRGKQIFEKMYALLINECKKQHIEFIWGFTYASKPFLKLNFQVPFRSKMGLLVLNPLKAADYFASLSSKNKAIDKAKIMALSFYSKARSLKLGMASTNLSAIDFEPVNLNSATFNYLKYDKSFGLKLDADFLNYRITTNPYNNNYKTVNYRKNGELLISITYHITVQKIGYIIHTHISNSISQKEFSTFLNSAIKTTELKSCYTIRFWGFSENRQNQEEIKFLSGSGFTFLNRGISFVWLSLNDSLRLDPKEFLLSRMASQGTD